MLIDIDYDSDIDSIISLQVMGNMSIETMSSFRDRTSTVYNLLLIPGAFLLIVGLVAIYWYISFESVGVVTEGTVVEVEFEPSLSIESSGYYNAIVEFRTNEGQLVRFKEKNFKTYVGNKIKVLYDPSNPSEAMMYSTLYIWIWTILSSFGAGFLGLGLWGWVNKLKSQRKSRLQVKAG